MRLLERTFDVGSDPQRTWQRLEDVASWPSWARHLRSASVEPPGALGPTSRGVFVLTNGMRTTFEMTRFDAGRSWCWRGKFLWMRVDYDHVLTPRGDGGTRVTFTIDGQGPLVCSLGRVFAAIYARNLDRAVPNLVAELART